MRGVSGECGPAAKAGKNTGGNPSGKGLGGLEVSEIQRAAEVGYWATSAARRGVEVDRQDPAPVSGRFTAPPAACSSRLMRS
jgi:hypothetical protein